MVVVFQSRPPPLTTSNLTTFQAKRISELSLSKTRSIIMAPSSASQPAYGKDEKVLCFHHELLYEAKVTDSKVKDPNDKNGGFMYQVHYKGWKKS